MKLGVSLCSFSIFLSSFLHSYYLFVYLSQTLNSLHNQFCVRECFQKSFCTAKWYYIYSGFLSKHFNLFSLENLLISSWFWVLDIKMSSEFSTKPSTVKKITIPDAKFEIEIFDGTNNFDMWQCKIKSNKNWILIWKKNLKRCPIMYIL